MGTLQVSTPTAQNNIKVRAAVGAVTGSICSRGIAVSRATLQQVWAKIIGATDRPPALPPYGPAPSVATGWVQGGISGTNWYFLKNNPMEIPGASCNTTGDAQSQLIVAGFFNNGSWTNPPSSVVFGGLQSNTTECGDYATIILEAMQAQGGGTRGVDTAPQQYRVEAQGFISPLPTSFNGSWLLRLGAGGDSPWTWDNGGDGDLRPRVELCCDGPVASVWQLLFRQEAAIVRYTCSAAQWRALGANVLSQAADAALATAPSSLTAEPC